MQVENRTGVRSVLAATLPLALLAVGIGTWYFMQGIDAIGPLDRAKLQVSVLPLFGLVPVAAGLSGRLGNAAAASRVSMALAALAVFTVVAANVAAGASMLYCEPASGGSRLSFGLLIGAILGLGCGLGSLVAARIAAGDGVKDLLVGSAAAIVTFGGSALLGLALMMAAMPTRCELPG